ncbi:MAG: cytochrome C [Bacteroidetes bacterium HGW-Bacteroidetes-1]|jgi:mono/diheme cytochrome c family protein|nr:MAG: cytochrome C [Bacteroidetes bacterium HGW-Bacteroidetes-1]
MKSKIIFLSILFVGSITFLAFNTPQDQKKAGPWNIPATYTSKKNPDKGDADSEKLGKALYSKHCRACHGNVGLGDGPKAKNLDTWPGDFSDAKFQAHSDGDLYYMSIIGRDEMPNFEKSLSDEESRWAVINYIRTFKK